MAYRVPSIVRVRKRVGRGLSKRGGRSGRGNKGQKARAGYSRKAGFEGGQTPLYMRLPKARGSQGATVVRRDRLHGVAVRHLRRFAPDTVVTAQSLASHGIIGRGQKRVKLIGSDVLDVRLTVRAHGATEAARAAVEKPGGKVEIILTSD